MSAAEDGRGPLAHVHVPEHPRVHVRDRGTLAEVVRAAEVPRDLAVGNVLGAGVPGRVVGARETGSMARDVVLRVSNVPSRDGALRG